MRGACYRILVNARLRCEEAGDEIHLVAGSFLHLQLMGLFWPLAGVAVACATARSLVMAATADGR